MMLQDLPLYLEGDALALYLEMGETDQASADKIEEIKGGIY